MLDYIEKTAKSIIESGRQHTPMVFMEQNNEISTYVLIFKNDEEKQKTIKKLRCVVQENKIKHYFVVMEGWIGNNPHVRPKNDVNRKEALIISEFMLTDKKSIRKVIVQTFTRENDKIVWGKREVNTDEDGEQHHAWDFFREDVMDEVSETIRRKALVDEIKHIDFDEKFEEFKKEYEKETGKKVPSHINSGYLQNMLIDMAKDGQISKRVKTLNEDK